MALLIFFLRVHILKMADKKMLKLNISQELVLLVFLCLSCRVEGLWKSDEVEQPKKLYQFLVALPRLRFCFSLELLSLLKSLPKIMCF